MKEQWSISESEQYYSCFYVKYKRVIIYILYIQILYISQIIESLLKTLLKVTEKLYRYYNISDIFIFIFYFLFL